MPKFLGTLTYHASAATIVNKFAEDFGFKLHDETKSPFQTFGYCKAGCYVSISKEDNDEDDLLEWMNLTSAALAEEGAEVLQGRIERVIFDTVAGIDEITPTAEDRGSRYDPDEEEPLPLRDSDDPLTGQGAA